MLNYDEVHHIAFNMFRYGYLEVMYVTYDKMMKYDTDLEDGMIWMKFKEISAYCDAT